MAPSTARTAFTAIWAALHTLQYGFGVGALNGVQDAVTCGAGGAIGAHSLHQARVSRGWPPEKCVPMTPAQFGLVTAIFTLGGLTGSLSANVVTSRVGRLWTLRLSAIAVLVGSAIVGLADSVTVMLIGRIIIGLGCGLATVTVPPYLFEIAPPSIKRSLGVLNQLFIVFGILIAQSLSFPWAKPYLWRWVMFVAIAIAVVQLLGSLAVVEPNSKKIRPSVEDEEAPLIPTADPSSLSITQLFTSDDPAVRRGFFLVVVTQLWQQLCGISPVMYFSTKIMTPVFQSNSRYIALAIVILKVPATLIPAFIIERVGSRRILLASASIMSVAALLLAIGLNTDAQALSVFAILLFVSAFSIGLGPVTWVVLPEVMPKNAVTAAGSVGLGLNWSTNFIMGASFLPLQQWLAGFSTYGDGNIFFAFAASCMLGFFIIYTAYKMYDRVSR